jgi:hypothetical protein
MKIKARITLVIGNGKQIAPNGICDVSEAEAKRLISRGFAESVKKNASSAATTETESKNNDDKSDSVGSEQSVQTAGNTGNLQE